ncbi:hypothetical protein HMPREF3056_07135 [Corynebacterium sp. HMSC056F09]|uniref:PTS sugar transporter subunit IIA n=1 Tax=Corynebacterium TaxID=1716 RepID=UPI0006691BA3|nr:MULTISPECIES: PTS sugar transporter subunit IIA [Corynebacterium]OFL20626.1 hypothetical protein HMPREF2781_04940 [Corynebacterium sp. HMSC062A03]OFN75680.1 hypothetical protein HMPREF2537_10550 [Corynebacterium sp. HMSC074E01]OFO22229.1 hypothetical protein HMPREF3056_07135 [Corynebacterium sp. HMSC056F09]
MLFDSAVQFPRLHVESQAELFKVLGNAAIEAGYAKPEYVDALLAREAEYPTGLPISGGVAIPHTSAEFVTGNTIAVATLDTPVIFHEMGGDADSTLEVSTVLLLILGQADMHVKLLSQLIKKIQKSDFVEELQAAPDAEALAAILSATFPENSENPV